MGVPLRCTYQLNALLSMKIALINNSERFLAHYYQNNSDAL